MHEQGAHSRSHPRTSPDSAWRGGEFTAASNRAVLSNHAELAVLIALKTETPLPFQSGLGEGGDEHEAIPEEFKQGRVRSITWGPKLARGQM